MRPVELGEDRFVQDVMGRPPWEFARTKLSQSIRY